MTDSWLHDFKKWGIRFEWVDRPNGLCNDPPIGVGPSYFLKNPPYNSRHFAETMSMGNHYEFGIRNLKNPKNSEIALSLKMTNDWL